MKYLDKAILIFIILATSFTTGCSISESNSSGQRSGSTIPASKYTMEFPRRQGEVPEVTFELNIPSSDLPEKLNVYKNNPMPDINRQFVLNLGAKFGMKGDILGGEVPNGTDLFSMVDNNSGAVLEIYIPTGTFHYWIDSKLYPKEKPVLPSDDEAKKIAMDFLTERGLLPEGDMASTVAVGGSSSYGPSHLLVGFSHTVKITGPGAKHGVRIGNNGEVVDVYINPINPLKLAVHEVVPAINVETAMQEIKTNQQYSAPRETKKVIITDVKISYWLSFIDEYQEFVVPVYRFSGQCLDRSGKQINKFSAYAHAVN